MLAQLRAGKSPVTAEYRHLIGALDSPACACGAAVESVRHLILECPRYELDRQQMLWDTTDKSLAVLSREPMRVLKFLQRNDRLRNAESAEDALARASAPANGPSPRSPNTSQPTSPTPTPTPDNPPKNGLT